MNRFLASLEITFRRDPTNFRPRVNKKASVKDREQKGASLRSSSFSFLVFPLWLIHSLAAAGNYFFLED
jgi:nitrate reductase NapE component